MKTALLFGSSGLIGGHLLNMLIQSKDYDKIKYTNIDINSNTRLNELKLPFLAEGIVYIISFDFLI